jgi:hypothetical protein
VLRPFIKGGGNVKKEQNEKVAYVDKGLQGRTLWKTEFDFMKNFLTPLLEHSLKSLKDHLGPYPDIEKMSDEQIAGAQIGCIDIMTHAIDLIIIEEILGNPTKELSSTKETYKEIYRQLREHEMLRMGEQVIKMCKEECCNNAKNNISKDGKIKNRSSLRTFTEE